MISHCLRARAGLRQRAAMLAHQRALDASAAAFYGAATGSGLQRDAAFALAAADAALGHCHDIEPSVEIMWELKGELPSFPLPSFLPPRSDGCHENLSL